MSKKHIASEITVVDWIPDSESEDREEAIGGFGGFFREGMRGNSDYFCRIDQEYQPYYKAIRKSVIELNIRHTGEEHQNAPDGVPLFSDGKVARFSWRAWGDLMAAIWSEEENEDYSYMDFYM